MPVISSSGHALCDAASATQAKARPKKAPAGTVRRWMEQESRTVRFCECGCGEPIVIRRHQFYEGIPKYIKTHDLYAKASRRRKSDREWADAQQGQHPCTCGCGESVLVLAQHRRLGIPKYRQGHHARHNPPNYKGLDTWVEQQRGLHLCECSCGTAIKLEPRHKRYGIPRFVAGHCSRAFAPERRFLDAWVKENQGRHFCVCGCKKAIRITRGHHSMGIPRYLPNHHAPPRLGHGPQHPRYKDRSLMARDQANLFTPWTKKLIFERCAGACVRCGATGKLEYDHILARSIGGSGEPENGQLLCRPCHVFKNAVDREKAAIRILYLEFEVLLWRMLDQLTRLKASLNAGGN